MISPRPGGRGARAERSEPWEAVEQVCTSTARAIVQAQLALDEHARERLRRWEEEGLPPSASTLARCRARVGVAFGCSPKEAAGQRTRLWLGPSGEGLGVVSFTIRHLPVREHG